MQCRSHAGQLARLYDGFNAANYEVLVILCDSLEHSRQYSESLHLPFPVLADTERVVYRQYGLDVAYLVLQRSASIVVDVNGVIRYLKRAANPMPWLHETRELLSFIHANSPNGHSGK